jgi:hypothetical protein
MKAMSTRIYNFQLRLQILMQSTSFIFSPVVAETATAIKQPAGSRRWFLI